MNCKPKVTEVDLVTSVNPSPNNASVDVNLINAWGIVVDDYIWVNANNADAAFGSDLLIRYDKSGKNPYNISFYLENNVMITAHVNPTGLVKNTTNGYLISDGCNTFPSKLLIASESGDLFGYNRCVGGGTKAYRIFQGESLVTMLTPNAPVYKGLAVVGNKLFAADFMNGNLDVFTDTGAANSITFSSHQSQYPLVIPNPPAASYPAPFNVVYLGNVLYVLYAYKNLITDSDDNGFQGFIDINSAIGPVPGAYIKRFTSDSLLQSPWALVKAPSTLSCDPNSILVGNFGNGNVYVYKISPTTGLAVRTGSLYVNFTYSQLVIDGDWLLTKADYFLQQVLRMKHTDW